jgi:hypothetical protein
MNQADWKTAVVAPGTDGGADAIRGVGTNSRDVPRNEVDRAG